MDREKYILELEEMWKRIVPIVTSYVVNKEDKFGLTSVQTLLLEYLKENGKSRVSTLADYMGVTMAAVSSLSDRLVNAGLIIRERSEEDRRVVYIVLTSLGKEVVEAYITRRRHKLDRIFETMGEENAVLFLKVQRILLDTLEQISSGKGAGRE